jgi:DNA-binding NtrC family response regulator
MQSRGVLFISPYSEDAAKLTQILSGMPLVLTHVRDLEQARGALGSGRFEIILTEAALRDGRWTDVLHMARQFSPNYEVIVTDAWADGRFWSEALNLGVYDLVAQPFHDAEVRRIIENACSRMTPPARTDFASASSVSSN